MKKILFLLLSFPVFAFAQQTKNGFELSGNVTGFENGTSVSFLNQQTQVPEKQATIQDGKFTIKGTVSQPSFIVLVFGDQPPAIPLFIDNSKIKITGDKKDIQNLSVTGSKSQDEFALLSKAMKPYESIFAAGAEKDAASVAQIKKISEDFVSKHPSSFVAPIAVVRVMQTSDDVALADKLYGMMSADVKKSDLSQYIQQQLAVAKINPIGSQIAEFSQEDTSGKAVKISSFKGKYVLIDFWASWCGPCRHENPNVVAAYNKFHDKNFTVLGVSLDHAKAAWLNAIHADGLAWTQVSDLKGWSNDVAVKFQVTSIPQNILIDPSGKIIAKNLRGEALDSKLQELLK